MKDIKDKNIILRLSASEKQKIQDKAKALGMTTSEFIRYACERIMIGENKKH